MLAGPALLAGLCFLFGIFPGVIIHLINNVSGQLLGHTLPNDSALGWLWLAPVSAEQASYSRAAGADRRADCGRYLLSGICAVILQRSCAGPKPGIAVLAV